MASLEVQVVNELPNYSNLPRVSICRFGRVIPDKPISLDKVWKSAVLCFFASLLTFLICSANVPQSKEQP
jgi:hypothetical protein